MGCACKDKERKLSKLIPDIKMPNVERKGIKYYLISLLNVVSKILVSLVALIIGFPLGFIVFAYKLFTNKNITIKLPQKIIKKLQKLDNG